MANSTKSWLGRRVFLTGHTGFKGSWLALWLTHLGAQVRGYALDPNTVPNLFNEAKVHSVIDDIRGDIRDSDALKVAISTFAPDTIFHLAAQPLVRFSYEDPIGTYETNVIGTAKLLNIIRQVPSVRAVVVVTTDKCYENKEWAWGYRESDPLGGYDPYSSSKACTEVVTAAFRQSYFPTELYSQHGVAISTARAGNVIGGGDWSSDRLLPDLIRGFLSGKPVEIRRPHAIRPWQHVLEPLCGYIKLAEKLLSKDAPTFARAYNFGPQDNDAQPVSWIADHMVSQWGSDASWFQGEPGPHEAGYLKLDASVAHADLGWTPRMNLADALTALVSWYQAHAAGERMHQFTLDQIRAYESLGGDFIKSSLS